MAIGLERRVQGSFFIAFLFILAITVIVLVSLRRLANLSQEVTQENFAQVQKIRVGLYTLQDARRAFFDDPSQGEHLEKHRLTLDDLLTQVTKLGDQPGAGEAARTLFKSLEDSLRTYQTTFYQLLGTPKPGERKKLLGQLEKIEQKDFAILNQISSALSQILVQKQHQFLSIHRHVQGLMATVFVGAVFFTLLLLVASPRYVRAPLVKINDFLHELRQGQWNIRLKGESDANELGILIKNINLTVKHLSEFDRLKSEKIRAQGERFERLINLIDAPLMIFDDTHHFIAVNNAAYNLFHLSSEEVVGHPISKVGLTEDLAEVLQQVLKEDCRVEEREFSLENEEGVRHKFELTADIIRGTDGRTSEIFVLIQPEKSGFWTQWMKQVSTRTKAS